MSFQTIMEYFCPFAHTEEQTIVAHLMGSVQEPQTSISSPHNEQQAMTIAKKPLLDSLIDSPMDKIERIKQMQKLQLEIFQSWEQSNNWQAIHDAHYDWWMFPVERSSMAYGTKFAINDAEATALKSDSVFMDSYRKGVKIVIKAWGWDLDNNAAITKAEIGQRWNGYGVRLLKIANSLTLMGENELYDRVKIFYNHCKSQPRYISDKDLLDEAFSR